jgi:hypothetical protein
METLRGYRRPPFEDALTVWKSLLSQGGYPADLVWILEENLCFERDPGARAGVKLGFQTQFTPHPPELAKVTYHYFAENDAPLVFYRLGSNHARSVCMLLCDGFFAGKGEAEGYVPRPDWLMSFFTGGHDAIEEVTDPKRWEQRIVRGRPLSAVDFCMTQSAIRELAAHGRVLSPDERFGLKILRSLNR